MVFCGTGRGGARQQWCFEVRGSLKEFSDVTLACEDGQLVEAHKVILAGSSD